MDIPQATAPPIWEGVGRTWGGLGEGATCVNCRLLPLRTVSSHSLLQTDKRGRYDLTPIVNWQLIICSLPIHTDKYTKDKDKDKDKERDKDKNKDKDGLFILRHKLSKEGEGTLGKL